MLLLLEFDLKSKCLFNKDETIIEKLRETQT